MLSKKTCAVTIISIIVLCLFAAPALAADLSEYTDSINTIYKMFKAIAVPAAVVGIVYNLFGLFSSEKKMEEAKLRIILILLALAGIYLLPLFIKLGASLFGGTAWDPAHP